jgi:hypothetical protein
MGQTGSIGPTTVTYSPNSLGISVSAGIQKWTVSTTGTYQFTVTGAGGKTVLLPGGSGATVTASILINAGTDVYFAVGQSGPIQISAVLGGASYAAAGGGASWVMIGFNTFSTTTSGLNSQNFIVAGGGGGACENIGHYSGGNAVLQNSIGPNISGSGNGGAGALGINTLWNNPLGGFGGGGAYGYLSGTFIGLGGGGGGYSGGNGMIIPSGVTDGTAPGVTYARGGTSFASSTFSGVTYAQATNVGTDGSIVISLATPPCASISSSSCYTMTGTYRLTPLGATGASGPSNGTSIPSTYPGFGSSYPVTISNGNQIWTVPTTRAYTFKVAGAQGGSTSGWPGAQGVGGAGAIINGTATLTKGTLVYIVVGQTGGYNYNGPAGWAASGGGGTFIFINSVSLPNLLVAAGGGGGATFWVNGTAASTSTSSSTGADGSLITSGVNILACGGAPGSRDGTAAKGVNGLNFQGGAGETAGGFGGGGGCTGVGCVNTGAVPWVAGGGGGYSGGSSGTLGIGSSGTGSGGGGGTSFTGSNFTRATTSLNSSGDGYVEII